MKRLLVLVALLLVFAAPAFAVTCNTGVANGANMWISFDELSGTAFGDNCIVGGNTTLLVSGAVMGSAGHLNRAVKCTGVNATYNATTAETTFANANSFSQNLWVNFTGGAAATKVIAAEFNGGVAGNMNIYSPANHSATFQVQDSGGAGLAAASYTTAINNGQWHMLTLVYYGNDTVAGYINGTFVNQITNAAMAANFYSAGSYYGVCDGWTGAAWGTYSMPATSYVDEISVYNFSLTPTQISNLYLFNDIAGAGTVTLTSPANSSYDNAGFPDTWYFTPVFAAPTNLTNCSMFANSTYVGSNTTLATGVNTSISWSPTTEGQYSWYVSCYDATAASWSSNSSAFTFYYDLTDPNGTIYDPGTTTGYAGTALTVNITATDNMNLGNCTYEIFYENGTLFTSNSTACTGTSYDWDVDTFTPDYPGAWTINATIEDAAGNSAVTEGSFTVNGIGIAVYNEKTFVAITCWNMTLSNSTGTTYTANCQNNTWTWSNFSTVPTGSLTVSLTASGYVGRQYYRTYNLNTPLVLDAYLLSTSDGIYSYFLVQSATGTAIENALLAFTFSTGGSTYTAGEVLTDSTGGATMWLDWTRTYLVTATATGYSPVSKSLTPQPTTYIIVMGSASVFNYSHLNDTLWTFIDPTDPGVNITTDSITAGLLDPDSGITICGLNLTYLNGTVFSSTNTTTEQYFCMNTIPLLGSGAPTGEKFYATLWYTVNGTDSSWTRLYNPLAFGSSLDEVQSGMFNYLGSDDARLILAVLVTLFSGAAAAMYLGIGATVIMMAVSGLFFYWGWFAGYELLYIITFVAGAALLYLETRT